MNRPPRLQRYSRWAGAGILAIAGYYFVTATLDHIDKIPAIRWEASAWLALGTSALCMFTILVLGGLMWMALLRDQGVRLPPLVAFRIVSLAQFAKYLPGNVGHLVGQVALASAAGVPVGVSITTMLISTLWLVATGMCMGGAGLLLYLDSATSLSVPIPNAPTMAVLGVAVATSPWIAVWLLNRFWPALSKRLGSGQLVALPKFPTALAVAAGFIACFFLFGVMLKLHALYLFDFHEGEILTFTLMFTTAWIAGYLLPGAPGGLGVREALTVALLGSVVGTGTAIGLSITMRLATVIGDGLAFLVGLTLKCLIPLSQAQRTINRPDH